MKYSDIESENCVLGSMLFNNSIIPNVSNYISDEDFSSETNRVIYRAINAINAEKKKADIVILCKMNIADASHIAEISDTVSTSANWEYYASLVKKYSLTRKFHEIIGDAKSVTYEDVLDKLSSISKRLLNLSDSAGSSGSMKTMREVMAGVCTRLEYAVEHKGELTGYDTGFKNLNTYIDGLQPELIFLGARPGIGKTAIGLNMAINMAKKGVKSVIFEIEMTDTALGMRAVSGESRINAKLLKGGYISEGEPFRKVTRAMSALAELPILIEDRIKEIHDIEARIRYLVRCENVQVVYIDHFSIIENRNNSKPRHEQYIEISGILRDLRKELKIPIVVMAQLKRDAEGKPPSMSDIQETGATERDADLILFLHRDRQTDIEQECIPTDLIVAKQREGACGVAKLQFFGSLVKFEDAVNERREESK